MESAIFTKQRSRGARERGEEGEKFVQEVSSSRRGFVTLMFRTSGSTKGEITFLPREIAPRYFVVYRPPWSNEMTRSQYEKFQALEAQASAAVTR